MLTRLGPTAVYATAEYLQGAQNTPKKQQQNKAYSSKKLKLYYGIIISKTPGAS
jgi:hypothetical protein